MAIDKDSESRLKRYNVFIQRQNIHWTVELVHKLANLLHLSRRDIKGNLGWCGSVEYSPDRYQRTQEPVRSVVSCSFKECLDRILNFSCQWNAHHGSPISWNEGATSFPSFPPADQLGTSSPCLTHIAPQPGRLSAHSLIPSIGLEPQACARISTNGMSGDRGLRNTLRATGSTMRSSCSRMICPTSA